MKLNKEQWSNQDYNEFINYLLSNVDLEYQKFHSKIVFNDESIILGVRTPLLKKIALEISKGNYKAFIKLNKHKYYEEIIIHGLIIGYLKEDFSSAIKLFDQFLNYIDNWAICDIICSNMKILKKIKQLVLKKF